MGSYGQSSCPKKSCTKPPRWKSSTSWKKQKISSTAAYWKCRSEMTLSVCYVSEITIYFSFTYCWFMLVIFRWKNCWKKWPSVSTGRSWWTLLCSRLQNSWTVCLNLKLWRSEIFEALIVFDFSWSGSSWCHCLFCLLLSVVEWCFLVVKSWGSVLPRPCGSNGQISHGGSCISQPGGQLSTGHLHQTQSLCWPGCHHSFCKLYVLFVFFSVSLFV